ncbi:MAG: xanthine dehydrogenase family protein subunit M [Candidatus Aureabacteria bacterium]|nr:xanthine dehydrogenase family protein subunit M [Candidatus Auribacterota bacterium]
MKTIETHSPRTLEEALALLEMMGDGIRVIAGATDVVVQVLERKKDPCALLNLSYLEELRYIREEGDLLAIGALTTHREIERSPLVMAHAPLLAEAAFIVGSPQIKNLGTVGGNIANASPVADTVPALMVLGATLILRSRGGTRTVPLAGFASGPGRTILKPGELITQVLFPVLRHDEISFYERLGQRRLLSISKVGVAFRARRRDNRMTNVAIALGAVAPRVIMAPNTAAFLEGKEYAAVVAEEAARIVETESKAITDMRSTDTYRNRMAGALLIRGMARVCEGITGL